MNWFLRLIDNVLGVFVSIADAVSSGIGFLPSLFCGLFILLFLMYGFIRSRSTLKRGIIFLAFILCCGQVFFVVVLHNMGNISGI